MILPLVFINLQNKLPSYLLLISLYFFQLIPIATLFANDKHTYAFPFYALSISYCVILMAQRIIHHTKIPTINLSLSENLFAYALLGSGIFSCLLLLSHYGFTFKWHDTDDLYAVREEFKENSSRIYIYLFNWFAYVINPLLFLWSFDKKKWIYFLASCGIQLYLFTIGGHKAVFLLLPFFIDSLLFTKVFF